MEDLAQVWAGNQRPRVSQEREAGVCRMKTVGTPARSMLQRGVMDGSDALLVSLCLCLSSVNFGLGRWRRKPEAPFLLKGTLAALGAQEGGRGHGGSFQ